MDAKIPESICAARIVIFDIMSEGDCFIDLWMELILVFFFNTTASKIPNK